MLTRGERRQLRLVRALATDAAACCVAMVDAPVDERRGHSDVATASLRDIVTKVAAILGADEARLRAALRDAEDEAASAAGVGA